MIDLWFLSCNLNSLNFWTKHQFKIAAAILWIFSSMLFIYKTGLTQSRCIFFVGGEEQRQYACIIKSFQKNFTPSKNLFFAEIGADLQFWKKNWTNQSSRFFHVIQLFEMRTHLNFTAHKSLFLKFLQHSDNLIRFIPIAKKSFPNFNAFIFWCSFVFFFFYSNKTALTKVINVEMNFCFPC